MGVLGWQPSEFWEATYWDYTQALVGFQKANRTGYWDDSPDEQGFKPIRKKEVAELNEKAKREVERRPEGPLSKEMRKKIKEARKE